MASFPTFLKKNWALLLIALVIVVLVVGYVSGYRIAPGLKVVQNGTLSISNLPDNTAVYTDESRRTYAKNGTVRIPLLPGSHTVIVDSQGYQPWNDLVTVTSNEDTVVIPIQLPTDIKATTLRGADALAAQGAIWSQKLPTKAKPLSVASGCAFVYTEGNDVIAEASTTASGCSIPDFLKTTDGSYAPTVVYSAEQLNDVLAYPNRQDLLLVASGGVLYALELDPREPRLLRSLVRGTPSIHAGNDASGALYAADASRTVRISLTK